MEHFDLSATPPSLDERYMRLALRLASKGLGRTSPNPAVGSVLVRDGKILATGWHKRAGDPHAEIEALSALSDPGLAAGATLYVTLEPCSTHGRTPPCTDAIVAAKIGRVVVGSIDVNPKHQGRGIKQLEDAGIAVTIGVLEAECALLNAGFNKWVTAGIPWVIAKVARSIDGYATRPPGEPQWLSNDRSLRLVHRLRATVDAILVGAGTVRQDDPRLTVRPMTGGLQPWRVVVTRSGNLPAGAKLLTDENRERTIIYRDAAWSDLLKDLGIKGVTRLLVEGGGDVLGQFRDQNLIDEVWCFITPLLTGGDKPSFGGAGVERPEEANRLHRIRYKRLGNDVLVIGHVPPASLIRRGG